MIASCKIIGVKSTNSCLINGMQVGLAYSEGGLSQWHKINNHVLTIFSHSEKAMPWRLSKNKDERIDALATALKSEPLMHLDVLCFQELWLYSDYVKIFDAIKPSYPYGHYFRSGVLGSGLCIFSKWPLMKTFFHQWPLNGFAHKLLHADWYGGKGVALAQIKKSSRLINVFNLHLHATYGKERYVAHRIVQAFETAIFVDLLTESADFTVLTGDLNSDPDDLCFRLIRDLAGLQDAHTHLGEYEPLLTYASNRNTFSRQYVDHRSRIDYILYKSKAGNLISTLDYAYALPELIPGKEISYSDHEALTATFRVQSIDEGAKGDFVDREDKMAIIEDLVESKQQLAEASTYSMIFLCLTMVALVIVAFAEHLIERVELPYYVMYFILRILVWMVIIYAAFMSSLWYWIESQTLTSTESSINVVLERLGSKKDA